VRLLRVAEALASLFCIFPLGILCPLFPRTKTYLSNDTLQKPTWRW
jgi:hypothetical protein